MHNPYYAAAVDLQLHGPAGREAAERVLRRAWTCDEDGSWRALLAGLQAPRPAGLEPTVDATASSSVAESSTAGASEGAAGPSNAPSGAHMYSDSWSMYQEYFQKLSADMQVTPRSLRDRRAPPRAIIYPSALDDAPN